MADLKPNLFTGVPYCPPEHRGPDGYMNRLGLDEDLKRAIFRARKTSTHILDNETGIYHLTDITLPEIFSTSDSSISGHGKAELNIDDIDGPTVIENIKVIEFSFSLQKTNIKEGTSYGAYDEYEIKFSQFDILPTTNFSKAGISKLEMKIKDAIAQKVRIHHIHANGED